MDVDAHDGRSLEERTMRRLAWALWTAGVLCLAISIALDTAAHTVDVSEISQVDGSSTVASTASGTTLTGRVPAIAAERIGAIP
jgi:hypothetical protein